MKLIVLLITASIVQSGPVRTSLCCCGCTEEPCPVVGANCPYPQLPCALEDQSGIVYCSELKRLWSMANAAENPRGQTRLPLSSHPASFPDSVVQVDEPRLELLDTDLVNKDIVYRNLNTTSEIRFSPSRKIVVQNVEKSLDSLEKMNRMLCDLQGMIATVKSLIDKEVAPKTGNLQNYETEELLPAGDITEEEEQQAIDDVIKRMKGTFSKVTKSGPRVNEIDSAISASIANVQSLSLLPMHIRPKRAATEGSGNCNDERLRDLITKHINADAKTSKRLIQKAAEKEFGGTFNVVCSPCEFSFVISSQKYCEGFKDQVACFVFFQ